MNLICFYFSNNHEDVYVRGNEIAEYLMLLVVMNRIVSPTINNNQKIIKNNKLVELLYLCLDYVSNFISKFEKLVLISRISREEFTVNKMKSLKLVIECYLFIHNRITVDYKKSKDNFKEIMFRTSESNFRSSTLFLKEIEVFSDFNTRFRPILEDKLYDSVSHYLDVNFSFSRKDCFRSLSNGIQSYEQINMNREKNKFIIANDCLVTDIVLTEKYSGLKTEIIFLLTNQRQTFSVSPFLQWKLDRYFDHKIQDFSHICFQS